MIIPVSKLDPEILQSIMEEFICREGTDYGQIELSLAEKVAKLRPLITSGEVLIVFDVNLETVNLIPKNDYQPD